MVLFFCFKVSFFSFLSKEQGTKTLFVLRSYGLSLLQVISGPCYLFPISLASRSPDPSGRSRLSFLISPTSPSTFQTSINTRSLSRILSCRVRIEFLIGKHIPS